MNGRESRNININNQIINIKNYEMLNINRKIN